MLVLNAFPAISEGLNLKPFRGSMPPDPPSPLTLTRSKWAPPSANLYTIPSQTTEGPP